MPVSLIYCTDPWMSRDSSLAPVVASDYSHLKERYKNIGLVRILRSHIVFKNPSSLISMTSPNVKYSESRGKGKKTYH